VKRALVLSTTFPRSPDDKIPPFVYLLCLELKRNGWDVIVLAPHDGGAPFREEMDGLKVYRFPYFYPFRFQRLCYGGGIPYNVRHSWPARIEVLPFLIAFFFSALWIALRERPEAIHSHWLLPGGFIGALVSWITGIPHVFTLHAGELSFLERLPPGIGAIVLGLSRKGTAVSHRGRRALLGMGEGMEGGKVKVIPMGASLPEAGPGAMSGVREKLNKRANGLFIGRWVEIKGLDVLVEAQKRVSALVRAGLVLCGHGPMEKGIRKLVGELGIEEDVLFWGPAYGEEKGALFRLCRCLVLPSIVDHYGNREGMPVVLLEALLTGLPIVATWVSGAEEVLEDGKSGVFVPPGDPVALAKALMRLLDSPAKRRVLSLNALRLGKTFTWQCIGARYNRILLEAAMP